MEKKIDVNLQVSYETLNELNESTERIWIVFHGYGMLSKYFIRKFDILDTRKNLIIAPQALSKFYLKGHSGRVGASWMTREDRLTEIDNQLRLIDTILKKEVHATNEHEIILLGFSQGTATACRYAAHANFNFSKLVLWSGGFPEDLDPLSTEKWIGDIELFYGLEDEYLSEEKIKAQEELLKKFKLDYKIHEFASGHRIIPELLLKIQNRPNTDRPTAFRRKDLFNKDA